MSCLPDFAQPYRLLCNAQIERGFAAKRGEMVTERIVRSDLIHAYLSRLEACGDELRKRIGLYWGRPPPDAMDMFVWLCKVCGGLAAATDPLVNTFACAMFGIYRCHQKRPF